MFLRKSGNLFYFLLFGFSLIFIPCMDGLVIAQDKADSLLLLLKKDKEDTIKVNHLNDLAMIRCYSDPDTSVILANNALAIAGRINSKRHIADSYQQIAIANYMKGDYGASLENNFKTLKIRQETKDKGGIAEVYNNIGNVYSDQGNYPEALKNYYASLKIREAIGNKKDIAISYNNIGIIYDSQKNYPEALKNYFAALKLFEEIGAKMGIAHSYNNIGIIYKEQGNYPEALKNYNASLKIRVEIADKSGISYSYNNIGSVNIEQGNYSEALKNYFASLKIREEIGDKAGIAGSYNNIGDVYSRLKKYKEAEEYLIKSKKLSEEIGYKENLSNTYNALTELDSSKGDFRGAFENHKLYILYRDSMDNEEARKKTIQTQMTYEFDKKQETAKSEQDKKDVIAEAEKRRQRIITYAVGAGLVLVLLLALFIFRGYRVKQKANVELAEKNSLIEKAKSIIEEKNKDITDSINYAQRIQRAFLASEAILKNNLEDYFVLFKPKDIVSGDFYWASEKGNKFYLAVCDSTGHGVPGAFMSLINMSFLNEAINKEELIHPNRVFNHVRQRLIENISSEGGKDGMDGMLFCFDKNKKEISYAAAYNSPLLMNGTLQELESDKMPVGASEKQESFTHFNFTFKAGNILYLYTDGYADQFGGPKNKKFRYKQLNELLSENSSRPLLEQKDILEKTFEKWKGGMEQVDDVLIIGIRI